MASARDCDLRLAITGGTGPYLRARGKVTVLILPGVPGGTNALVTVDLKKQSSPGRPGNLAYRKRTDWFNNA